jgi:hypothetical protein
VGPRGDNDPFPSQLFAAVTAALAAANARPKNVEVMFRSGHSNGFALTDKAFYIPPRMEPSMASMLGSLKTLHLTLNLSHPFSVRPFIFQKFLSLASNVTSLRLNFNHTTRGDCDDLLSWLALRDGQKPQAPFELAPIQLPYLERLDLGMAPTEAKTILNLVAKFAPTLTSLSLRRVNLYDPNCHLGTPKISPWTGCLSTIARLPGLNLRVLALSLLSHGGDTWRGDVHFDSSPNGPGHSTEWTCSANLVTMDKALAQAIAAMRPTWPLDPPTIGETRPSVFLSGTETNSFCRRGFRFPR